MTTRRPKKIASTVTLALRTLFARKDFAVLVDIDGAVYCTTAGHLFGVETRWNGSRPNGGGSISGGFRSERGMVFHVRAELGSVSEYEGEPRQWLNRVEVIEQVEVVDEYPVDYARALADAARRIDRFASPAAEFRSAAERERACRRAARALDIWAVRALSMFLADVGH